MGVSLVLAYDEVRERWLFLVFDGVSRARAIEVLVSILIFLPTLFWCLSTEDLSLKSLVHNEEN